MPLSLQGKGNEAPGELEYWRDWKMENRKGRKPKYLTVERWERWLNNDWHHLTKEVSGNKRLLWIILGGLIIAALIERVVG